MGLRIRWQRSGLFLKRRISNWILPPIPSTEAYLLPNPRFILVPFFHSKRFTVTKIVRINPEEVHVTLSRPFHFPFGTSSAVERHWYSTTPSRIIYVWVLARTGNPNQRQGDLWSTVTRQMHSYLWRLKSTVGAGAGRLWDGGWKRSQ